MEIPVRTAAARLPALFLAATLLTACADYARAQNCSNDDFKGVYSAVVLGSFISIPGLPAGPTNRVGRVQVDGNGVSSITATVSLFGVIAPESYGGTYTISSDCTASVILQVPFPGVPAPIPLQFTGVLASGGRTMNLILTNPQGTDLRITLSKQRKPECSAADVIGDYALSLAGTVINVFMVPPGYFARVGKVTFDGVGSFTASEHTSYAGFIAAEKLQGTYTVDATCVFKATSAPSSITVSWYGVLSDTISGMNLIDTSGGSVITGTLTSVY